ncbi:DUF4374 domain-containing protein [Marinoscillum pacificum]|uniref:DUF4374 domain-containing protein n=1 Tax=Marinoscillum pacificum TaxID=392723 RepID=UPI00215846A4|nr:DUF4374 domain-containing protein [Marinoscillum pacificum]
MKIKAHLWLIPLTVLGLVMISCSENDNQDPDPVEPSAPSKYFIAAENNDGTYFIAVDSLTGGITTTSGNGIEDPNSYTHYAYNGTDAVLAISYRQGNPAVGRIFGLDELGLLSEIGAGFQMTAGFSSLGPFENYLVATRRTTFSDETQGQNFYFIDLENDAAISDKQLATYGILGDTLDCQLVGVVDAGDGTFLSAAEVIDGDVDDCYMLKLDGDANVVTVLNDDRIGRALGQFRSARYSLIANDDEGNTFVFANPIGGTKKGAALKINQGETDFDDSYYFNIQDLADDFTFRKVWHLTGKYFLLEFYNELEPSSNTPATQYGIVNMDTKSFNWVTGIPSIEDIDNVGWPYAGDDLVYLPITTVDSNPVVYVVDPETASAYAGVEIESATGIGGLAKLTY